MWRPYLSALYVIGLRKKEEPFRCFACTSCYETWVGAPLWLVFVPTAPSVDCFVLIDNGGPMVERRLLGICILIIWLHESQGQRSCFDALWFSGYVIRSEHWTFYIHLSDSQCCLTTYQHCSNTGTAQAHRRGISFSRTLTPRCAAKTDCVVCWFQLWPSVFRWWWGAFSFCPAALTAARAVVLLFCCKNK